MAFIQSSLNPCFVQNGGRFFIGKRLVGWLAVDDDKERIFVSPRKPEEHLFRMFNGYGVARNIVARLVQLNVKWIWIKLPDRCIKALVTDFVEHGAEYKREPFETQLILSIDRFEPT
jgi:hypothetical protein